MIINKYDYLSHMKNIYNVLNLNKSKNIYNNEFSKCIKNSLKKINYITNNSINYKKTSHLNYSKNFINEYLVNIKNSKISLELMIEIRNQMLSIYHEIMNIQI
ncbi:flagellar hook-basal body complex protein FliE [Buchnera aphidicola (Periphyllus koelreuteriae)]|uniref:flagellar hook-basal body complex protein FliE n=1 Tax=Buchnera aphidicola TaxID=9 RepID=UPI0031B82F24